MNILLKSGLFLSPAMFTLDVKCSHIIYMVNTKGSEAESGLRHDNLLESLLLSNHYHCEPKHAINTTQAVTKTRLS